MTTRTARLRPFALIAALGLTLGTLTGCSGDEKADKKPSASPTASETTKAPEKPIETAQATPSPSQSSAAPSPNLADAFAGYGNSANVETSAPDIPGTWDAGEYVAQNAKGDIQIVMLNDEVRIYSDNWNNANPYGTMPDTGYIANGIVLTAGAKPDGVTAYGDTDWPLGKPAKDGEDYRDPQIIKDGQALEYGKYVCGSNDKGVTCWNTTTGHGAFVTAQGFTGF